MDRPKFSEGNPNTASIILVGEAPGADEAREGGAFIGKAGQLLTDLLANAGINRQDCYLDNVLQFRPDGNDISPYIKFSNSRVTTTETFDKHKEELVRRLKKAKANVIVALGGVPTYALTGLTPITKQRGSVVMSEDLEKKVIPCIHPSAALREYLHRYPIIIDLSRAKDESPHPEIRRKKRNFILEPTFADAMGYLDQCDTCSTIAYDIEVKGHELSHMALAVQPDNAICIPFIEGMQDYWTPDQEASIMLRLAKTLEDPTIEKIGQNLAFDATFLYTKYGIVGHPLQDTMIAAGILYPDFPKGLDFLTSLYCDGEPYYKDDGKEWMKNPFGSDQIFRHYNAMDAAVLLEIFPRQTEELKRSKNYDTYLRQKKLLHPLVYAGNKGIDMDLDAMEVARLECEDKIEVLTEELNSLTGEYELNPNSTKQLQEYFYQIKGESPYTKKGSVTTDDKALKRLATKGYKEATVILSLRHERKMLGTYYNMKLDEDGRMRCSFNPVGTEQGRISSSKTIRGTGGNLQNQPTEMGAIMRPDPEHILINQDMGQEENRVVAYISGESKMINAFEQGIDIHSQTGAMIRDVSIEEVTDDIRFEGKRANHGLNYDLGYKTFALYYQIPEKEAQFIVERYHEIYPGVRQWHNSVRDELSKSSRTLINCFGRRRSFLDRWGHELFKVAYSYVPQSTVAEQMNQAGVVYLYERQDLFPEVQFLNTIHDSIRYQIPLSVGCDRIVEIIKLMKASLETPIEWKGWSFSIPCDAEIGFSFDKNQMLEWKAKKVDKSSPTELAEELADYVAQSGELG